MATDYEIRKDVSDRMKQDEIFRLLVRIANRLEISTDLNEKWFQNADDVRFGRTHNDAS